MIKYKSDGDVANSISKQLTKGTAEIRSPAISPDGKMIAYVKKMGNYTNIHLIPVEGGQPRQLTFLRSQNHNPVWSPDGRTIAFGSDQDGERKVWRVNSKGEAPRPFAKTELADFYGLTWSPGSDILYQRPGNRNIHLLDPVTEEERSLVTNDSVGYIFKPLYAPDGNKVAVSWIRPGSPGLWIISLEDSSQLFLSERELSDAIKWSEDGKGIYVIDYKKNPSEILVVPINGDNPKTFMVLPFALGRMWYIEMTPDERGIVGTFETSQSDVWLMENFDAEVD